MPLRTVPEYARQRGRESFLLGSGARVGFTGGRFCAMTARLRRSIHRAGSTPELDTGGKMQTRRIAATALSLCWLSLHEVAAEENGEGPIHFTPIFEEGAESAVDSPGIPILFHGGPVMGTNPDGSNTPNLYYIWYGNWDGNTALDILPDLAANIGGSPYFNINTTYTDAFGNPVINAVNYGDAAFDFYSQGTTIGNMSNVVRGALDRGDLPLDYNGIYFVLTSRDVTTSGFCSRHCGYHGAFSFQGTPVKYGFIGNSERCLNGCARNRVTSPNDNLGADGMANIIAHELEEAVTDPQLNAWYDSRGQENADKCAWTFSNVFTEPNGSAANMTLGARDYLIQRNWANDGGGYCAQFF